MQATVSVDSHLHRLALRKSHDIGKEVAAAQIGSDPPFYFVASELLVGSEEHDILARCAADGGELIEPKPVPPQPPDVARTRHPRSVEFARPVIVRIKPRRSIEADSDAILGRARNLPGACAAPCVKVSSAEAIALAGLALELEAEGHDISLNYLGEPCALKYKSIDDDPAHPLGANAAAWPWIGAPTRIAEAWQLFESYRSNGTVESLVWIAIFDNGYWLDANGAAFSADLAHCSPMVNLNDGAQPIGGAGVAAAPWHGNWVADCAVGLAGSGLEGAGSGGTIAHGALFRTSYAWNEVIDCLVYATAWGLDIVNMSYRKRGGFSQGSARDAYNRAFKWAADNGVIIVVAAGNDGLEIPRNDIRPAAHTPGVITCGNIDPASWAAFGDSNYGDAVHIWAPGTNIVVGPDGSNAFPMVTGTSFAAPFVAGVIAMMRAVKPSLGVDEARRILRDTAWAADIRASHALDAYAALLRTMNGRLPDEFEEWAGGNNSAAKAALLAPTAGSAQKLTPIGGIATHNAGDHDWWRFSLTSIRTVTIRLEWYPLLGNLNLLVEPADEVNGNVDALRMSKRAGTVLATGVLGPGTYRLRVTGSAITAYEISVRLSRATLLPDLFEPNNALDRAAPLLFHSSQRMAYVAFGRPWWGPGTFDATLNWRSIKLGTHYIALRDVDYFLLDGRVSHLAQERFCSISHMDEPIDITLYDKDRKVVAEWPQSLARTIKLVKAEVHYLGLAASKSTRYKVSTYMLADPRILPPGIDIGEVFPEWWGKNPFVKVTDRPIHYLLNIGVGDDDVNPEFEADIVFEDRAGNASIALLDAHGRVVRSAETVGQPAGAVHAVVPIAGLPHGAYFVRVSGPPTLEQDGQRTLRLLAPATIDRRHDREPADGAGAAPRGAPIRGPVPA